MLFSVSNSFLANDSTPTLSTAYGAIAVATVIIANNILTSSGLLVVKYNQDIRRIWQETIEPYLIPDAISILTVGGAVLAIIVYGPPAAVVVVLGSIGSQFLIFRSREQVIRIGELEGRVRSLEESLMVSSRMFGDITIRELGRRDGYTHQHAVATAVYAEEIARELGLEESRIERLRLASLLHNIGLFEVPEEVLLARGKLNSLAWESIRKHPIAGEKALANVPEFEEISTWVRWHHERVDGRGYPDKLRGPWIPPEARIISVAQAYAAMVLDQTRRPGLGYEKARDELQSGIDSQFDGDAARALIRLLETESPGYRNADDHRFVLPVPDERPQPTLHTPDEPQTEDTGDFRSGSRRP